MTPFRARLYAGFAIVYLVWGSSFLVIRIGVTDLPPLLFAASRAFIGGLVLLALALYRQERLPRTRREWGLLFGFSLVLLSLTLWIWWGRRGVQRTPLAGPPLWRRNSRD